MAEIAFHFNAPDKQAYACRLLRKALSQGARVTVTADPTTLARLDSLLWTFSQTDFIAHVRLPAAAHELGLAPVVLAADPSSDALPHRDVLVNLGEGLPTGFDRFQRVIEVVGTDDADRQLARSRWKQYAAQGYDIARRDLQLAS
jgi:DNA polymerase III subunit chi